MSNHNQGPRNHNRQGSQTSPETDYSDLDKQTRQDINKLVHSPIEAGDMAAMIDLMIEGNKSSGSSDANTEYSEALKQRLDHFMDLKGVTKVTLLTFNDLRKATDAMYGDTVVKKSNGEDSSLTNLNSSIKFTLVAIDNPEFSDYVKYADKSTMQPKARRKRRSDRNLDPSDNSLDQFLASKTIDGIRTWRSNPENSPNHDRQLERDNLTRNLVNTPISVENMRALLDAVKMNFDDLKNKKGSDYIGELQARLDSMGDTGQGEHVDLNRLSEPARQASVGNKPKYSKDTVDTATYEFIDQFIDLAEISPELQETQDNAGKYTIAFNADTSTGQASGPEGQWISESRGDGKTVWFTKEQYAYNKENEDAIMRVQANRDLGFIAARMVGIKRGLSSLRNNTYTLLWKKIQQHRKRTKDKRVNNQLEEVAKAPHARVMEKRQKKLNELIKKQTKADKGLQRVNDKIKSREAGVKATQQYWIERKATSLGKKEARKRINGMKDEYNFFERSALKRSITTKQKTELGMIIFNRSVVESNLETSRVSVRNTAILRNNLLKQQANLATDKETTIKQRDSTKNKISRLDAEINQLKGQTITEDIQTEIDQKDQERLYLSTEVKRLNKALRSMDNKASRLETRIGDLPSSTDLKDEHAIRVEFADRKKAELDNQNQAWDEEIKS